MTAPRRLVFQLTPLLDLLLIVIFAQYLEVRTVVREETNRFAASQQSLSRELDSALDQLLALKARLADLEELESDRRELSQEVRRAQAQRDLIGEMVVQLFHVPESAVEAVLRGSAPGPASPDVAQLKEQLEELSRAHGEEIVEHLLTFHEMRKRCDLWDIYIQEDGQIVFTAGDLQQVFRAEMRDAFVAEMYDAYKSLPQPKSLVLVLISYGDARLGVRQAVIGGMPPALEKIRADDEGRSRYDFAVLGFRPEPPRGDIP
jgi:hypothetical protein